MTGTHLPHESRTPEDRLRERAANVNKGIRKVGKARWEFRCGMCGAQWTGVDHWTVYEFGWNHNRDAAATHAFTAVQSAINTIANGLNAIIGPVADAVASMQSVLAQPLNTPHDPSLLRDKRKWGGK